MSANNINNNTKKITIKHCKSNIRKSFFSSRVAPAWNALKTDTVNAKTTNHFKNLLDKEPSFIKDKYKFDE